MWIGGTKQALSLKQSKRIFRNVQMKNLLLLLSAIATVILPLRAQQYPPVYVVLFTHIEDNTPSADLSTPQARTQYVNTRSGMIEMAKLAQQYSVAWSFQPDWKILLAALKFEDSALMQNTDGKNVLRYLKENLNVVIDPHSHEKQGYNYTDVAHLLDSLGTGGSTVIGGHVWDASLAQFQNWDRYRIPVQGTMYPWSTWRGDILMGSGTPNHVNDPVVTGVWRPKDRNNYFTDDPLGNISCVGQYKGDISSIAELVAMYRSGKISSDKILTSSFHIKPSAISTAAGLKATEDTVMKPLVAMRDRGEIVITDFTSLISEWKTKFNSIAHIYDANTLSGIEQDPIQNPTTLSVFPHPVTAHSTLSFHHERLETISIDLFDLLGRFVAQVYHGSADAGVHSIPLPQLHRGQYFVVLRTPDQFTRTRFIVR